MNFNALIRKAVEALVTQEARARPWSAVVLEWKGDAGFEPFESHRADLLEPAQDPIA
jgi:hypothetical protein